MKRGTHSVRGRSIIVVVAARRVQYVCIVSVVIVAGTEPSVRCELSPQKVRILSFVTFFLLSCLFILFRALNPAGQKAGGLVNLSCDYFRLPYGYRLLFARGFGIKV